MPAPISNAIPLPAAPAAETIRPGAAAPSATFADVLRAAVDRVELSQDAAERSVSQFLDGETEDLHTVGLATQRAELELELFVQVRNKAVQAYQEIMRMQM